MGYPQDLICKRFCSVLVEQEERIAAVLGTYWSNPPEIFSLLGSGWPLH